MKTLIVIRVVSSKNLAQLKLNICNKSVFYLYIYDFSITYSNRCFPLNWPILYILRLIFWGYFWNEANANKKNLTSLGTFWIIPIFPKLITNQKQTIESITYLNLFTFLSSLNESSETNFQIQKNKSSIHLSSLLHIFVR